MLELIAAGAIGAVASAAATVIAMRHNLATDRAELAEVEAEQDHRDKMQDARYYELVDFNDRLVAWSYRQHQEYAAQQQAHPDTIGGTVEEEDIEVPVNRGRFGYDPTATDRVHTVARPEAAEVLVGEQSVLFAEKRELEKFAASVVPTAVFGSEHFESEAFTDEIKEILVAAKWYQLEGGELTEALVRAQPGMPTGQYPIVPLAVGRLVEVDGPDPKRIAATRAMHLAAVRGGDDMPVPVDPPVPTSGPPTQPTPDQPANPHTPPGPPVPKSGPRPGSTQDTDGRPSQPKPAVAVAA